MYCNRERKNIFSLTPCFVIHFFSPGLQNFDIVALAQIVTLMLSVVEALYFGYMLTINKFKDPVWEPLWVTLVEACVYAILLATGSHRFEMKDGSMVNIISPMAWCLACPIAMSFMMRMSWPEAPQRTTLALIMNLEAVLLIGIISGMSKDWGMKVTLFVFAALLYALLCTTLIRGMFYGGVKPRTTEAKFILLFFLSTWMIFPIVWLLGPSMLGLWSYEVTLLLFAAGDIFAKNIFTYIGYKYTEQLLTAEIEMKELEQNGGMEMLGNGPLTVGAVLNRDNRKDDTSSQISEVDYLHIASVIEHLEEGNTIRSNPLKKETSATDYGTKYNAAKNDVLPFNAVLRENVRMLGIAKDHDEQVDFTVTTLKVEALSGGAATHTLVSAKNDTNDYPFEFTVIQNEVNEVVFCDLFHRIEFRDENEKLSGNVEKACNPALMPSPNSRSNSFNNDVGVGLPMEGYVSPANTGKLSRSNSFNSNNGVGAIFSSPNKDQASFTMFPLPKDLEIFAWKDGVSKKLKIGSSKVINLGDGKEGNTILSVDQNGEMDAFVIVTYLDAMENRQVMSCKYDNLTLADEKFLNNGLFPSVEDDVRSNKGA